MRQLYKDYVSMGGKESMSSFKNREDLMSAIRGMNRLTRLQRAKLRRWYRRNNVPRVHGSKWELRDVPKEAREYIGI
jgi:hypothetical protein